MDHQLRLLYGLLGKSDPRVYFAARGVLLLLLWLLVELTWPEKLRVTEKVDLDLAFLSRWVIEFEYTSSELLPPRQCLRLVVLVSKDSEVEALLEFLQDLARGHHLLNGLSWR